MPRILARNWKWSKGDSLIHSTDRLTDSPRCMAFFGALRLRNEAYRRQLDLISLSIPELPEDLNITNRRNNAAEILYRPGKVFDI